VPSLLLLVVYLIKIKAISFHFTISSVTKRLYKRMATFGLFLFSGIMLNVISRTSDIIIISSQSVKGLSDTAVFVVASYFISIMEVPQKSMASTTLPFFAEAWKNKDLKKIHSLYQKTSLNMLLIGFGIAGLIILNIDNCISFLGDTYKPMKLLVLILATGKILDLGTGQNGQILLLSKYWKVDFISNILFVFMAIPLNFFLIKSMGLMGAAYASLIALGIFNLIRFIYIWFIFKMQPFTKQTLYGILIFLVLVAVIYVIPFLHDIYTDSIVRTLLFSILYVGAIKWANVSTDITALINNLFKKIGIA
jgi:O-antigen/teichoic acid export membrane protein